MKFTCFNCGRFFSMDHPFISFETVCPYCKDSYFADNVVQDVPPDITDPVELTFPCGHSIITDMVKDVVACPVCGISVSFTEGASLKEWQNSEIKRIGL